MTGEKTEKYIISTKKILETYTYYYDLEEDKGIKRFIKSLIFNRLVSYYELILANKEFYIAQNITVTELYSTIYSAATNYIATDLEVSKDGVVWDSVFLQAGYDEEFIIEKSNIEIEELL